MDGFVYIMTNEAFPDLIKIGKTKGDPAERAKELYTTSTPKPFKVEYQAYVEDYDGIEKKVHEILRATRENKHREFFSCTVPEAITIIEEVATIKFKEIFYLSPEEIERIRKQKENEKIRRQQQEEAREKEYKRLNEEYKKHAKEREEIELAKKIKRKEKFEDAFAPAFMLILVYVSIILLLVKTDLIEPLKITTASIIPALVLIIGYVRYCEPEETKTTTPKTTSIFLGDSNAFKTNIKYFFGAFLLIFVGIGLFIMVTRLIIFFGRYSN